MARYHTNHNLDSKDKTGKLVNSYQQGPLTNQTQIFLEEETLILSLEYCSTVKFTSTKTNTACYRNHVYTDSYVLML